MLPRLSPNLLVECPPLELATDAQLQTLLQVHTANMARAKTCAERHNALVKQLEKIDE